MVLSLFPLTNTTITIVGYKHCHQGLIFYVYRKKPPTPILRRVEVISNDTLKILTTLYLISFALLYPFLSQISNFSGESRLKRKNRSANPKLKRNKFFDVALNHRRHMKCQKQTLDTRIPSSFMMYIWKSHSHRHRRNT